MRYFELISLIKDTASKEPNINTILDTDIYDINNIPDTEYSVFAVIPNYFEETDEVMRWVLTFYVIDRLNVNNNRVDIHSQATMALHHIIGGIKESVDVTSVRYTPFIQKFNDITAGVYATVVIEEPIDDCYEDLDFS